MKESLIELQNIDCNCNDCKFMDRDFDKFSKWKEWNMGIQLENHEKEKAKAINEAQMVIGRGDEKSGNGMMRIALKMKFQFDKSMLMIYGRCSKLDKELCFLPNTCQIETQKCFEHRRN